MKKGLIALGVAVSIGATSLLIHACKKDKTPQYATTNSPSTSELKINNTSYHCINLQYNNPVKEASKKNARLLPVSTTPTKAIVDFNETAIGNLISDLKLTFHGDIASIANNAQIILLYTNGAVLGLPFSNVKGISIFTANGTSGFLHRFFNTTTGTAVEDNRMQVATGDFNASEVDLLSGQLSAGTAPGWLMVRGSGLLENQVNIVAAPNGYGQVVINTSTTLGGAGNFVAVGAGGAVCSFPCDGADRACRIIFSACAAMNCVAEQSVSLSINNGGSTSENPVLSLATAYSFRDNFLATRDFGKKYINYYYAISYVAKTFEVINNASLMETITFAKEVYNVASTLQSGQNTDIVISPQMKADALAMIAKYKTITPNSEYQNILKQIESDVNRFAGKTRAEVLVLTN